MSVRSGFTGSGPDRFTAPVASPYDGGAGNMSVLFPASGDDVSVTSGGLGDPSTACWYDGSPYGLALKLTKNTLPLGG